MRIGIIGAGNIGGNLTRRFTALGHDVAVANSRGPGTLADLAAETGARAVPVTEAARDAEVVIVTIPQGKVPALPDGVLAGLAAEQVRAWVREQGRPPAGLARALVDAVTGRSAAPPPPEDHI